MYPYIAGLRTYFLMWAVAGAVAIPAATLLAAKSGFAWRKCLAASSLLGLALLVGAKLMFLVETVTFPSDDPFPAVQSDLWNLATHGFRNPGGIMLLLAMLPLVARGFGLDTLRFADATVPAAGLAIFFYRLGCFLNGCCFGAIREDSMFAVSFPPTSRVFQWQVRERLLTELGPSLPVIPLQLYHAMLGLGLFVFGMIWQQRKLPAGEGLARFAVGYFGGTVILESMQVPPYRLNIWVTGVAFVVTCSVWTLLRSGGTRIWAEGRMRGR